MRFVPSKRPLPRCWKRHPAAKGLVAETDIRVHRRGRLAAKLLVFDGKKSLRKFWRAAVHADDLGPECYGVVNAFGRERWPEGERDRAVLEGDARYFCLVGLCLGGLSMEVVTHEAVHAAFNYEKRVKRNLFGPAADFDEERIAYPAGIIAAAINRFLHSEGLYEKQ